MASRKPEVTEGLFFIIYENVKHRGTPLSRLVLDCDSQRRDYNTKRDRRALSERRMIKGSTNDFMPNKEIYYVVPLFPTRDKADRCFRQGHLDSVLRQGFGREGTRKKGF